MPENSSPMGFRPPGSEDRYEAQPALARLPAWVWQRLPRFGKVLVVIFPFAAVGVALALAPGIDDAKQTRAQAERERSEQRRAARAATLREEQRPRSARLPAAPAGVAERERLVAGVALSIERDARARAGRGELNGPIRRAQCEPFPRSVSGIGAEQDPSKRYGSYACVAVTSSFGGSTGAERDAYAQSEAGVIGHPYRVRVDFDSGRYAFCKVSGRAGEGSIGGEPAVTVPKVCGGL